MDRLRRLRGLISLSICAALLSGCGSDAAPSSGGAESAVPEVSATSSSEVSTAAAPNWEDYLSAELVEFSVSNRECSYDDGTLELLVTFTNVSSREIAAIQAGASVTDLFDEEINSYNISSDKSLPAGKSVKVGSWGSSCYGLNDVSADDSRLLEMEDVATQTKLVIRVEKIAFKDGEVLEF